MKGDEPDVAPGPQCAPCVHGQQCPTRTDPAVHTEGTSGPLLGLLLTPLTVQTLSHSTSSQAKNVSTADAQYTSHEAEGTDHV